MAEVSTIMPDSQNAVREHGGGLAEKLSLSKDEFSVLAQAFVEAMAPFGLEGRSIVERMVEGDSLAKAMDLPHGTVELLYARAHQWVNNGRFDRAEQIFRALCILEEGVADYWVGYAICLMQHGASAEAQDALLNGAQARPQWALPYFYLLDIYVKDHDIERAELMLAAFDERVGPEISQAIRAQVDRLRLAIKVQKEAAALAKGS